MKIKGLTISDAPNILYNLDAEDTGYYGFRGYQDTICPICAECFYYNKLYYPEAPPPTCGRYSCLRAKFMNP